MSVNQLRVAGGLVVVAVLVALAARDVRRAFTVQRKASENVKLDIVWFEEQCTAIRDQLPERGAVGYRDLLKDPKDSDRRHALVQYALVPIIVEWKTPRLPAVEVFDDPRSNYGRVFGNVRVVPTGGK
jgi:hypothetical protein